MLSVYCFFFNTKILHKRAAHMNYRRNQCKNNVFLSIHVSSCQAVSLMPVYPDTKFMEATWGPPGSCRPQMGPMLAPWTLLSGLCCGNVPLRRCKQAGRANPGSSARRSPATNTSQHWFRWWRVAWRHQAITWTMMEKYTLGALSLLLWCGDIKSLSILSAQEQHSRTYCAGKVQATTSSHLV